MNDQYSDCWYHPSDYTFIPSKIIIELRERAKKLKEKTNVKCELCGDPATTWNCFGDGPKRVCKGCDDSINEYYGEKCDLHCMTKTEKPKDE